MHDNNKISKDELLKICPVGSRPGILYDNPKIHKSVADNMPKFRPILFAINTPGYNDLDVESLFTNISLKEIINNCVSDLHNKNLYNGKLNKSDLFKLLETATSEASFIFDFLLYKQIDGVAMGSPLGPTLANVFLCHYEKEWLDKCTSHFKPIVYRRYVDDIFVLFHLKNISSLLQTT